jgi:hypothetical protein
VCLSASASQISPSSGSVYVGYTSDSLRGYLDELKFYDHALTQQQLALLTGAVATNDPPTAAIGTRNLIISFVGILLFFLIFFRIQLLGYYLSIKPVRSHTNATLQRPIARARPR